MMRHRDRVGLNFAPLLLRLMLGVIFLQAGLGKVLQDTEYAPEKAIMLAQMGVLEPPVQAIGEEKAITIEDYPNPVRARRVYGLALRIHASAWPEPMEGGAKMRPIWPPEFATGQLPVMIAWIVAGTEIAAGAFVLVGLLTRFAAFGLACVMIGAMWLDQIGPAVQNGQTMLGFLPRYDVFDPAAWQKLWLQFALFMSALALAFLGPGRASMDALLTGRRGDDDDE
jgi:uncharacterized membrane protein YphA (DoxX/SURF4 family)